MEEPNNTVFESEKEFLENQELEYKNALLHDVAIIKDHSEEIGKKVLLAGGVLAGVWLITKLISGRKKKKKKKAEQKLLKSQKARLALAAPEIPLTEADEVTDEGYHTTSANILNPDKPDKPGNYALHYHAPKTKKKSGKIAAAILPLIMKTVASQAAGLLLALLSKKAEEFLHKNPDIATVKTPETTG